MPVDIHDRVFPDAAPYTRSIGPTGEGKGYPGHCPGDNWLLYPGPDGLRGSLRMTAFREGMLDHALPSVLARRRPEAAEALLKRVVRSLVEYSTKPEDYHALRAETLDLLDAE